MTGTKPLRVEGCSDRSWCGVGTGSIKGLKTQRSEPLRSIDWKWGRGEAAAMIEQTQLRTGP
jgi:hypothetical protein